VAGKDRGGLRESVAEEELCLFNFFGGFPSVTGLPSISCTYCAGLSIN